MSGLKILPCLDDREAADRRRTELDLPERVAADLGRSAVEAARYAIRSRAEAAAYLRHPVLGPHLRQCAEAVLRAPGRSATAILGSPDDLKLRSSMTLFAAVSDPGSVFHQVLERFHGGAADPKTLAFLDRQG